MNEQSRATPENTPTPEQIAARYIRLLRQGRGWSQQEVAEKMRAFGYEWSQATVTRLESASRPIRLNELADLAALFGIPVTQFMGPWGPDFNWDDPDAMQKETEALMAEQEGLKEALLEMHAEVAAASMIEAEVAASLARVQSRLGVLKRWSPQAPQGPQEAAEGGDGT